MGAFQSSATRPNAITTQQDQFRATGTYFGPNFILESNGISPGANSTRAFFEDIMNVLSTNQNPSDIEQLQAFGDIYAQLPPAELKTCTTIQSKLNVQKSSLRLSRIKDSASLRYHLEFRFDLIEPASIRILWGAKEKMVSTKDGSTYKYIDKDGNPAKEWKFGPFPAGLNQVFELPKEYIIDHGLLQSADMGWVTEMNLETPLTLEFPMSPTSNQESLEPLSPSSPQPLLTPESVAVQIEPKIKQSAPAEPSVYHLIIVVDQVSQEKQTPQVDSQSTFVSFGPSNEQKLVVQFMKQLVIIDRVSYVLQEIYGFTEVETDAMGQKECVVCMSEAKDTLVLPCRHLCLCKSCGDVLRRQGRTATGAPSRQGRPKCPICRQVFHSLIQVTLPPPYHRRDSVASRSRSRLNLEPSVADIPPSTETLSQPITNV